MSRETWRGLFLFSFLTALCAFLTVSQAFSAEPNPQGVGMAFAGFTFAMLVLAGIALDVLVRVINQNNRDRRIP